MKTAIFLASLIAAFLLLTGCNSTTTITETYGSDGKTVTTRVTAKASESPLTHKTFSVAGSVTALDVETSASASSETAMPHIIIGGSAVSISSAASDDNKPTFGYAWSAGIIKSLSSSSATSGALTYTGIKGETADDTAKRIEAILKLKDAAPSASAETDSSK